jgi:hypothetical protein
VGFVFEDMLAKRLSGLLVFEPLVSFFDLNPDFPAIGDGTFDLDAVGADLTTRMWEQLFREMEQAALEGGLSAVELAAEQERLRQRRLELEARHPYPNGWRPSTHATEAEIAAAGTSSNSSATNTNASSDPSSRLLGKSLPSGPTFGA